MTDELLSLRALVVAPSAAYRNLFRQAGAASKMLIEIIEADTAAAAAPALAGGLDLAYLDAALPSAEIARVAAAYRGVGKPPFTVLLAAPGVPAGGFTTDAVANKPRSLEEAQQLVERSMGVRLPNRVLLVDDSSTMRSIVRKILSAARFPFEVSEASEGFAAIELAKQAEFDIVFLDYNMPGFSGLETLSEFKRQKRRMTMVVITSAQDTALEERVRAAGAAFLKKPFYPADIEAVLTRHYGLTALNPGRG